MKHTYKLYKFAIVLVFFGSISSCIEGPKESDKSGNQAVFKYNFGFEPPASVKEIKSADYGLYDSYIQWMGFTYDSIVLDRIISNDKSLILADDRTLEDVEMTKDINSNPNKPDWFKPASLNSKIYFKRDYLKEHTSSEYCLYVDSLDKVVYLCFSYFD